MNPPRRGPLRDTGFARLLFADSRVDYRNTCGQLSPIGANALQRSGS
jgi:hypothetical protein